MSKEEKYLRNQKKKAALAAEREAIQRSRLCDKMIAKLHWEAMHIDSKHKSLDGVCIPTKKNIHKILV